MNNLKSQLIRLNKIKKIFRHKNGLINIFENVSFQINSGDLVALVGPSGSGKSLLLNILALLDKPTSGSVFLFGKDTNLLNSSEIDEIRRKKISIIFQDNNLLSDFTAVENVLMPLIIRNDNYKLSVNKAIKVLKKVNLGNRLNHFPSELSGGEQQRVAIARSLIAETNLILADEPTGNLDYKTSQEVFSYFLQLKKMKKAIIFATHNRELANKADYKLSISNGTVKRTNG